MESRTRSALAGVAGTLVWAVVERADMRVLRHDYSDVAVLGKALTRSHAWPAAGVAWHAVNGAVFGLAFHELRRRVRVPTRRLALGAALAEHVLLFPAGALVDRFHPARDEPGVASVTTKRAFAQATFRHAVFGVVLGRLA